MASSLILFEDDAERLNEICSRLNRDACACAVFLIETDGQLIASAGETDRYDAMSLAALTAGNVAAVNALAHLVGEDGFDSQFHAGVNAHIFISAVGESMILVVVFNERSSLGLVRLKTGQFIRTLESVSYTHLTLPTNQCV